MNENLPVKRQFQIPTDWGTAIIDESRYMNFSFGSIHPDPEAIYVQVATRCGPEYMLTTLSWEAALDLTRLVAQSRKEAQDG